MPLIVPRVGRRGGIDSPLDTVGNLQNLVVEVPPYRWEASTSSLVPSSAVVEVNLTAIFPDWDQPSSMLRLLLRVVALLLAAEPCARFSSL